jgi:hypothetical protein
VVVGDWGNSSYFAPVERAGNLRGLPSTITIRLALVYDYSQMAPDSPEFQPNAPASQDALAALGSALPKAGYRESENDPRNRMKQWYNTFRFFFACAVIFGSGYFFAKPRNDADKLFAPIIAAIGVSSLWRARKSKYPEPSQGSDFQRKNILSLILEWGLIFLAAILIWAFTRFGV